ncbi:phosphopantothenate--cysteine ligase 1 [Quercus suber]|uniref:Phosphopantothenate--cysteine ligase 1 n=1 Tax=Quercus suber TaxID=58331 RepID=A0AAW0IWP4_QUESU
MELKFFICLTKQLEIDIQILLEKVDMALKKYKMHMVVANAFLTHKDACPIIACPYDNYLDYLVGWLAFEQKKKKK